MKKNTVFVTPRKFLALLAEGWGLMIFIVILMALSGCSQPVAPSHSNPYDPDNPDFTGPTATIVSGPGEGDEVSSSSVTFVWTRNIAASQFSTKIDTMPWSGLAADTSKTYTSLADGPHQFQVKAFDQGGYEGAAPEVRNFSTNRYYNTVMLYPLEKTITVGDTLELVAWMEDMATPVSSVKMTIYVQSGCLDTITASADTGIYWASNGGIPVGPFYSYYSYNYVEVNLGVAGGSPAGISGSGRIFKFKMVAISYGTTYPQITALVVRDTLNNTITTTLPPICKIIIQSGKEGVR